ncbi:MAG: hypothetical protein A2W90_00260 [Bacteroidetes bacterium GWF2_42_66]|nr:MAG: hypothetical protein A2W92_09440 [Bacteroidetes bacterium GWA2_42_15]OFX97865.1 MAG: hypothetical protein A2W89_07325 [Bacteroidetes bacterium GWE2_42_39]OFY44158.1 MAG: hypothetical protein A2W90_00260 [Bacteroidetes bacterium GWF2_42_66]HBL74594.1 N-acetyltransferase [Prolixibacteraceae bacterium]HCR91534.1 N-acetyltransferase [Prolixibacteraceae bacterium]
MSKIEIRLAERKDVAGIIDIYKPYILETAVTFDEEVPSEEEMWGRVQAIQKEHPYLVCIIDGQVAGYAYYSAYRSRASYRWSKEISVYVHPRFRKNKVASALYSTVFEIARAQGIFTLLAIITIPNEPSISFHEKLGFTKCAEYKNIGFKLGEWRTVGWWQYNLFSSFEKPGNIIPLKEIVSKGSFPEILNNAKEQIRF